MPDIPATTEITTLLDSIIPLAIQLGLVVMLGIGLVLWIIGQRMVRSACIFAGLMIGGLVAFIACQQTTSGSSVMLWVMGGSIGGAVSAVFFFRIWMGIVLMLMLGLAIPAVVLVWQGNVGPITGEDLKISMSDSQSFDDLSSDGSIISKINTAIRNVYESQRQFITTWYHSLRRSGRITVSTCAIIGGLIGMVFGLAAPKRASCVAAAFTGSIMIVIAANGLLAGSSIKYSQWLDASPRTFIVLTGLITILGVLWQWMLFARKADK